MFPSTRSRRSQSRGFTLVEMLTAFAVLAILVIMLAKLFGIVSTTWLDGQRRVNNFTKARAMLDLLSRDLQSGLFRSDLAAFPDSEVTFYTCTPGMGGTRDVSLVNYAIAPDSPESTLQRSDLAISWPDAPGAISFGHTADFGNNKPIPRDTSSGVVGFAIRFLYKDGTSSMTYTYSQENPLTAVGVALAVVDDKTVRQLSPGQLSNLRAALAGAVTGNVTVKADWDKYLNGSLNWDNYPKSLAVGFKVFERYVYLTP